MNYIEAVIELHRLGFTVELDIKHGNNNGRHNIKHNIQGDIRYIVLSRKGVVNLARRLVDIRKEEESIDRQNKYMAENTCPTCGQFLPKGE